MSRARDWRRRYPPEVRARIEARRWRTSGQAVRRWRSSEGYSRGEFSREKTEGQQAEGKNRFGDALRFLTFPTICRWRMEAEGREPRDLRIPIGPPKSSKLFGAARAGGKNDTLIAAVLNGEFLL